MIKVLHVCSDTNIGGAGKYLLNLFQSASSTVDLFFLLPRHSKLAEVLKNAGAKVIELNITADKSLAIKDVYKISRLINRLNPDIVHTHASLTSRLCSKLCNKKVIYTRHYVDALDVNTQEVSRFKKAVNNALCDGVIGVANETLDVILKMGIDKDKVKIILNGVAPINMYSVEEKDNIKHKYNIPNDKMVILLLSRLSKEKGADIFVDVVGKIVETNKNVIAIIAGTGKEEQNIRDLIEQKGMTQYIRQVGFIENVAEVLNITDVILNTSITEAQSLSLCEAMSLGIPAVATNTGGNPSLIKHDYNGYIGDVGNITQLAFFTNKLLNDDIIYKTMSQNALKEFKSHHISTIMSKQTEEFYKHILKQVKK
ncbi:MAG: hypothetical protein BEN19_07635 [Epulopiscium sp. Nuni2H_MBin003]|nr:MAG: hypothetical protein BEN19_07635 [Epulopiscium sp. Nuni2H_MBin003]